MNIRLIDFGLDKTSKWSVKSSLQGTRYLLDNINILKSQLKAILRFSSLIKTKIIYPFITNTAEIIKINKILELCKIELAKENYSFDEGIQVICLIETPAAAVMADNILDLVDEVMVGTNDLTQYTLAASRCNKELEYIFDQFDSSVLRLIKNIVDMANSKGKKVTICGELPHSTLGVLALLVLGAKNISCAPKYLIQAKKIISNIDLTKTNDLKEYILNSGNAEANKSMLNSFINNFE